ncbi:MAG: hypothetical protein PHI24_06895 [Desulfitobacteriaceae bacterium]|nr:hypothetical protein [Desulfitobacteriaceae bacterium]
MERRKGMYDLNELKDGTAILSKSFDFTILTPLFMHGWHSTDDHNRGRAVNAELRGSSIRGVLRYWWRSLQTGNNTPASLLQKEQALFGGSSGGDESTCRSPLLLMLSSRDREAIRDTKMDKLCPHRGNTNMAIPSFALKPERKLRIEMKVLNKDSQGWDTYVNYFLITFMLAGFGQRSRRGSGAVQLDEFKWMDVTEFRKALQTILTDLHLGQEFNFRPNHSSCLVERTVQTDTYPYPRLMRIWLGQASNSAKDVRTKISEAGHIANPGNSQQMLGNVGRRGTPRLASPLLCTVRRIGRDYYPLVSEMSNLHMNEPDYTTQRNKFLQNLGVSI